MNFGHNNSLRAQLSNDNRFVYCDLDFTLLVDAEAKFMNYWAASLNRAQAVAVQRLCFDAKLTREYRLLDFF